MALKVVVRYADGKIVKGTTNSFNPAGSYFFLTVADPAKPPPPGQPPEVRTVELAALKAIFFVKDFVGQRDYVKRHDFSPDQPYQGRKLKVHFADGETMVGSAPNYDAAAQGFFMFPADPNANTVKLFAVAANVKEVEIIP